MSLQNINPTTTKLWQNLEAHFQEMKNVQMKDLFANDAARTEKMHIQWNDFLVDFSKNIATTETIKLLTDVATEVGLQEAIEAQFGGATINVTENRAVLHTALRAGSDENIVAENENIFDGVTSVKQKIKTFSDQIINGDLNGFTNKPFTDVVNIGIGGSDLGPAMVVTALEGYKNHLNVHFVSNVDGDHVHEIIKNLNPETTLFLIVSKTFTTQETLSNSETIKSWFLQPKFGATQADIAKHFVAVSTNTERVTSFGIHPDNIFPMKDWVGGRFSLWSAVGLSISLAVGYKNFEELLLGANEMDIHFRTQKFENNIPVILAMLSIWYNNFFDAESEAVIPYSQYLSKLAPYLQQAIMESNGKSVDRNGNLVNYQTGNIVWGEPGTNSQHAFFQLIHQGTKLIPCDFIGFKKSVHGNGDHHDKLMSNFFAQTEALLNGKTADEVQREFDVQKISESEGKFLKPFKVFSGNKPTNTLLIDKLTPKSLGSLLAMYEHKIFVQGVVWNIFSYDQWGVELGKQLASKILTEINDKTIEDHDSSTTLLLRNYLKQS